MYSYGIKVLLVKINVIVNRTQPVKLILLNFLILVPALEIVLISFERSWALGSIFMSIY